MTDPSAPVIVLTLHFNATPEQVFDAWLDPALIGRWMFSDKLMPQQVEHIHSDARVGGAFSFLVRRQDQLIDHVGQYRQIERPRRLAFSWGATTGTTADMSEVVLEIRPDAPGCDLELRHTLPAAGADYTDRTRNGWTCMLGELAQLLAAPPIPAT